MIRIYFSPVFDFLGDHKITYKIDGEKITATYQKKGQEPIQDEFDFTGLPEGRLNIDEIETAIPFKPISNAYKTDGVLYIEVVNFIAENASEFEKFPNWIEV